MRGLQQCHVGRGCSSNQGMGFLSCRCCSPAVGHECALHWGRRQLYALHVTRDSVAVENAASSCCWLLPWVLPLWVVEVHLLQQAAPGALCRPLCNAENIAEV
jgi:hypothetical protein